MKPSRRNLLGAGLRLVGLASLPPLLAPAMLKPTTARAATIRFSSDPFTLGVASGYPEPQAVVLWTRLAPEPLVPWGGMPREVVTVDWELADDQQFRNVRRSGRTYATPCRPDPRSGI